MWFFEWPVTLKTLGLYHGSSDTTTENWNKVLTKFTKTLNLWRPHNLTPRGKSYHQHVGWSLSHGWSLSQAIETNKVVVKSFPGASCEDMEDYLKPVVRKEPEHIIIHVGTNDLGSTGANRTAESIVNLGLQIELPQYRCNGICVTHKSR